MTMYAYFGPDRECIAVNDTVWPTDMYNHVSTIEAYRNPNDIYWNSVGAGTRIDYDMSLIPDYLEVGGAGFEIICPLQTKVRPAFGSTHVSYDVPVDTALDLFVELVGQYRGSKVIHIVDLATRKAAREAELSLIFDAHLALGCTSPLGWVDCDDKAKARMSGRFMEYEFFGLSTSVDTEWTMFDQSTVTHTYTQFVALCTAITDGFQAYFSNKQALAADIEAASDLATLEAIDLESGWPT
jgi:hypothetical protein